MLAGIGSMPADTPPEIVLLETVGAIANKWVLRIPVPRHHSGSPYSSANFLEAVSASFLICEKILFVQAVDPIELNGNPFCCRNVCHPNTPNPNALPFLADL